MWPFKKEQKGKGLKIFGTGIEATIIDILLNQNIEKWKLSAGLTEKYSTTIKSICIEVTYNKVIVDEGKIEIRSVDVEFKNNRDVTITTITVDNNYLVFNDLLDLKLAIDCHRKKMKENIHMKKCYDILKEIQNV